MNFSHRETLRRLIEKIGAFVWNICGEMGERESSSTLSHTETLQSPISNLQSPLQPSSTQISLTTQPSLPGKMNFSHTETLRRLIDQILLWVEESDNLEETRMRRQMVRDPAYLEVVRDHASVLGIRAFMEKTRRNQASYANLDLKEQFTSRNKWVVSFLQDLEEVFKVPKLNRPRNVQVASFMAFLVQLLIDKPLAFDSHLVISGLQSFNTILLDSPFQSTHNHSEVQSLLSQFETLANESGKLVYSYLVSPHPPPIKKIDEILSKPIILLKDNVIEFFNSPSYINTAPNTLQFALSWVFIVDSFLYDLENLINRKDDSVLDVKNDVEKLHRSLKHSWSLLNKHYDETDELKQIVMLAFDAEYLVNYFLCGDAPAWYIALRLPHIIHSVELVGSRLQELIRENHDVDHVFQVGDNFDAGLSLQTGTTSGMDGIMVGFEDEEQRILVDLVRGGKKLQIISIIGMPGLGKTTLAKKIYNHPNVRGRFDRISWCIVSQAYKTEELLVEILTGLDSQVKEALTKGSEKEVRDRIYKTLFGRRYFIVVDDIWEVSAWEGIKWCFPDDGNGSRILLTSRNKEVADQCNSTIYALPLLSSDQCWELLQNKVFHGGSCPPELEETGRKIVTRCNGLPLVVVVVSGILSTMENDLSAWENVRKTLDSHISSYQDKDVAKSLELSYMYLPHHLKPCFLYFGRFREDEHIIVKEVVRLWIAEGFIPVDKKKRSEDIAKEYMKDLIGKNLIMVAKKNHKEEAKVCTMHDLLRDMCLKIVADDNFMTIVDHRGNSFCDHRVERMICHSSLSNGWFQPYSKYIRSFVLSKWSRHLKFSGMSKKGEGLDLKVGHMKVLRIFGTTHDDIPPVCGVENLVHLRYLEYRRIPGPIDRFSILEFLIVRNTVRISSSFLDAMMKLRYLRANLIYLEIDYDTSRIYKLEYISKVIISKREHVQQLKAFPHLRKLVCKINIGHLSRLLIQPNFDLSLLIQLESLISLTVSPLGKSYGIEITFPSSIIKLSLQGALDLSSSEQMSIIGALPKLEVLKLISVDIGGKWETRDNEFQKLKYLKLELIPNLVEWNVSSWEHFPVLRHLIVNQCQELEEIPSEIICISTLQSISVRGWCKPQFKISVNILKEQLLDEGNEDVTIVEDVW